MWAEKAQVFRFTTEIFAIGVSSRIIPTAGVSPCDRGDLALSKALSPQGNP
jgi:hypothetical protein